MTTLKRPNATWAALACTTTALAGDGNLLAGRQSAAFDNTTPQADDVFVGGGVATSGAITAGTVEIWASALCDGTNFTAGAGGGDSTLTLATTGVKDLMQKLDVLTVDTTARTYYCGPYSIANAFGGTMVDKFCLFIVHNLGSGVITTTLQTGYIDYTNS